MQLRDPITKAGYFWLPNKPTQQLPGTLTINEQGASELEALGIYGDKGTIFSDKLRIGRIVGVLDNGRFVTLDDCYYKLRNHNFGGVSRSLIKARLVFIGIQFDAKDVVEFDSFRFSVQNLDDWLGISGIECRRDQSGGHTITYKQPPDVVIPISEDLRLAFTWSWKTNVSAARTDASVSQKAYVKVTSTSYLPIQKIKSLTYKLTTFFSFVMGRIVNIDEIIVSNSRITATRLDDKEYAVPITLYYESLPFGPERPSKPDRKFLVPYNAVARCMAATISSWLDAYERIAPALNLYFAAKSDAYRFIDGEFLSLVQSVETFHRRNSDETELEEQKFKELRDKLIDSCPAESREWLSQKLAYANELSLRRRLKRMIKPFESYFGKKDEKNRLIGSVVATRNWLTHYDEALRDKACYGKDLISLSFRLECLLDLHLLKQLGLSDETISGIVDNNESFRKKLDASSLEKV